MIRSLRLCTLLASMLCAAGLVSLSGCAAPATAIASDTSLQASEGLVAVRVVDVGRVPIKRLNVVSTTTGETHQLRPIRFGQTTSTTYVGRLPAGRYQPSQLIGVAATARGTERIDVPLAPLTGKFDVEAHRVTDLGTIVFTEVDDRRPSLNLGSRESSFKFALPLDPTPVATEALIKSRYPQIAGAIAGRSALSWVPGTVPKSPDGAIAVARARAVATIQPTVVTGGDLLTVGALGVIDRRSAANAKMTRFSANTIHGIESMLILQDGRWLVGGEEGYLAVSSDNGARWQRLSGVDAEGVIIQLAQGPDGRVFMVVDRDREAVVYESQPNPMAWKEIKRLPSDREQSALTQELGEAKKFLRDYAGASSDRLVVYTRPDTLASLDMKTGAWSTHTTPRTLHHGIKVTKDGLVVAMQMQSGIYGSVDYGATWTKMDAYVHMSEPHFLDRQRGVMIAAETKVTGLGPYKLRSTTDGGKTWQAGADLGSSYWQWMQPLWVGGDGKTLYTVSSQEIRSSTDDGRTWRP